MIPTLAAAMLLAAPTVPALDAVAKAEARSGLKLDDLFPRKPFFDGAPTAQEWSKDGRYLAYAWLPYGEKGGRDLYVYDTKTDKATRLTSPALMGRFDRDVVLAEARYRQEAAEEEKSLALDDAAYREWRQKRKEDAEKRKEPLPAYRGVGEIEWAPRVNGKGGDEMLFTFGSDVFRTGLDGKPARLTRTPQAETNVRWLPGGDGYTCERDGSVVRTMFNTGAVEAINPKLPDGFTYSGYRLSPDGKWLMVTGYKASATPSRQVDYITYRDRFATAKKAARDVAEDEFRGEQAVYLYDLSQDSLDGLSGDGKPWEVWKYAGGKEFQQIALNDEPWSKDSKRFTFGTWRRTAKEQTIVVADVATKTTKTIYTAKPDGEMNTPGMADPFFTQDGKGVIALLDATGYRQAWLLNPDAAGAKPLTTGDYDLYPLQQTADGKALIVAAGAEDPARYDLYRVDMATSARTRLTKRSGRYNSPVLSDDGSRFAALYASWSSPTSLVVGGVGDEKTVLETEAPDRKFDRLNAVKPQRFTFKNRHGQNVQGFMFLPPDLKPGEHRPLWIYVYGGPLGTDHEVREGVFSALSYLYPMYLARTFGYVACTVDPRGSSGYGAEFGKANYGAPGKAQVEDLADAAKWMQANHGTDPAKTAVNGWSFGGFQTQMCLYTAPDTFTLGIAVAGPTEWQNYNNWYSTGTIGPVPNGKPEDLDPYSLTSLAKNLQSPLLLMHGIEDTNVLFQDTVKVYRKLLQAGKGPLVELAVDPTGEHSFGGDLNMRDTLGIWNAFLAKWWGPYTTTK